MPSLTFVRKFFRGWGCNAMGPPGPPCPPIRAHSSLKGWDLRLSLSSWERFLCPKSFCNIQKDGATFRGQQKIKTCFPFNVAICRPLSAICNQNNDQRMGAAAEYIPAGCLARYAKEMGPRALIGPFCLRFDASFDGIKTNYKTKQKVRES